MSATKSMMMFAPAILSEWTVRTLSLESGLMKHAHLAES